MHKSWRLNRNAVVGRGIPRDCSIGDGVVHLVLLLELDPCEQMVVRPRRRLPTKRHALPRDQLGLLQIRIGAYFRAGALDMLV